MPLVPYEVARYSRKKDAKGETKHLRNSTFEMLLKHFPEEVIEYFEYGDYYVFLVEDNEGIRHEAHIFMDIISLESQEI